MSVDFAALLREAFPPPNPDLLQSPPLLPPSSSEPPRSTGHSEEDTPFIHSIAEALERIAPHAGESLQPHQQPPLEHEDPDSMITGWVMMAGRDAGKTYAGARWLHRKMSVPGQPKRARIIAPTFTDAVAACIEGPSGILEASNHEVQWKPSHAGGAQLQWSNGSVCYVIGTPTPRDVDRLRAVGNMDYDWFEEAAANPQLVEAERQCRLSRRRKGAKWICTTTPRPLKTIRDWQKDPSIRISRAASQDNKFGDPLWQQELEKTYKGTRLYRQEVLGEVIEDVEGALWQPDHLERSRIPDIAELYAQLEARDATIARAAVGVDPANSTGTTGIVTALFSSDRHLYVVEDASLLGRTAEQWARAAVEEATRWNGPIIPENDSGGDAIRAVLKAADLMDEVTIMPATARGRGGKGARAEPIALLWEREDVRGHLVGHHPLLEEELTTYVPGETKESPDRLDAMVWACTFLWGRATFADVESHWPGHSLPGQGNRATARRPGAMIRWHSNKRRTAT